MTMMMMKLKFTCQIELVLGFILNSGTLGPWTNKFPHHQLPMMPKSCILYLNCYRLFHSCCVFCHDSIFPQDSHAEDCSGFPAEEWLVVGFVLYLLAVGKLNNVVQVYIVTWRYQKLPLVSVTFMGIYSKNGLLRDYLIKKSGVFC